MAVLLLMTVPRTWAYPGLVEENLAMRTRIQDVERRMDEASRMMARLRLYDAQLQSLSRAPGDHGPLPDEAMTNGALVGLTETVEPEGGPDPLNMEVTPEMLRPAEGWALDVADRVSTFIDLFQIGETDLDKLIAELESLRAIRDALPGAWPAEGLITSGFGWRSDPVHSTTSFTPASTSPTTGARPSMRWRQAASSRLVPPAATDG